MAATGPELARFVAALFYSGIFWMMVLFLVVDRHALDRTSARSELVPLAIVVLIASAYLFLGVVAHQEVFAMPLPPTM